MIKLAIDFGSSMTKIYRADTNSGIVLAEPSCVAVSGGADGTVRAIGKEAKNLIGKTAKDTDIIDPIVEGKIANPRLAAIMLKEFFKRIDMKKGDLRFAQVLFSIPCGLPDEYLEEYVTLAKACGLRKVYFVEQAYLAALGSGAILSDTEPVFCLDIGGGVTNVAVISADGIISGLAMNVGGKNMDANTISRIVKRHQLLVGDLTAEKIKNGIGSLSVNAQGMMVVQGRSTVNCQPSSISVLAEELTDCISVYVDKIVEYALMILRDLPAEVAATVNRGGVYLSGGAIKLHHMPQYIANRLGMRFRLSEEPQFATVLGGGELLQDKELLKRFARKVD
jgi:rod shape-determining protein MreB